MVKLYPGVAQLVARMVRVHEAVGSTPATRTNPTILVIVGFSLYFNGFSRFWMVKIFFITSIKIPNARRFIFDFTNGFTNGKAPALRARAAFVEFCHFVFGVEPIFFGKFQVNLVNGVVVAPSTDFLHFQFA